MASNVGFSMRYTPDRLDLGANLVRSSHLFQHQMADSLWENLWLDVLAHSSFSVPRQLRAKRSWQRQWHTTYARTTLVQARAVLTCVYLRLIWTDGAMWRSGQSENIPRPADHSPRRAHTQLERGRLRYILRARFLPLSGRVGPKGNFVLRRAVFRERL